MKAVENEKIDSVLVWLNKFHNVEFSPDKGLADVEASSARVCKNAGYVIDQMAFGTEPSSFAAMLDVSGEGSE
jgi:hypothetical protein